MNYSPALSNNDRAITKPKDIVATRTYEELSMEFKELYPIISKALQLIGLMYNRLTIVDGLSHKEATSKIYEDHKHLQGFSQRNIRRSLMSLNNPNISHRTRRKIRPIWPNSGSETPIDTTKEEELSCRDQVEDQLKKNPAEETECSNCNLLLLQTQKLNEEKSKVIEGYEQALQVIKEQEQRISEVQDSKSYSNRPVTNIDGVKVLEQEISLLYGPLQQAMASTFRRKENTLWLTIRLSKNIGNIIAVYAGRKSNLTHSSQSILSNHG
jgi:hypothetical protein